MKKIYSIRHTLWYQRELEFDENEQVAHIKKFINESLASGKEIGEIADLMSVKDDEGNSMLRTLLTVALHPYHPTPLHRLWNMFWAWYYKIPFVEIKYKAPDSVLAPFLLCFFFFKNSWTMSLITTMTDLASSLPKELKIEKLLRKN